MVMPDHLCLYRLETKDLLERRGFTVEDHHLKTHHETEAFKYEHGIDTTLQTFIGDERIGGYDELREHFGQEDKEQDETSHQPFIASFSVAFLMALAVSWYTFGTFRALEWFIALSMCILGIQKLQDVESFSTMFLNHDLMAGRRVRYGCVYPFGEALAGDPRDRRRTDLGRGTDCALHRNGGRSLGVAGSLHRQARADMRLRSPPISSGPVASKLKFLHSRDEFACRFKQIA